MKTFKKTALIASMLLASGTASAANMYIDTGDASLDPNMGPTVHMADPGSTTGQFNEFGFSQILATSIYDMTDGSIFGSFYDTNIPAELTAAGVPASGIAMDGATTVSLVQPNCAAGQCDIDALSPLVPPLGSDNEGFLLTWDLQVQYHFEGTLTPTGPVYTSGYFDVFFNALSDDTFAWVDADGDGDLDYTRTSINGVTGADRVLRGTLTSSYLTAPNLQLFFDITYARDNWLYIENSDGAFVDAQDGIATGDYATLVLDTNVDPAIPTTSQLLQVGTNAIRQTRLDGSVTASVPEPSTIAMLGLGLLGLGAAAKRKRKA